MSKEDLILDLAHKLAAVVSEQNNLDEDSVFNAIMDAAEGAGKVEKKFRVWSENDVEVWKYRIEKWFKDNCLCGGGYYPEMQEDELVPIIRYNHDTGPVRQCFNWLRGSYGYNNLSVPDEDFVKPVIIECIKKYTNFK